MKYIIGDIHGELEALQSAINKILKHTKDNKFELVFLGDYVDRGPDSCGVLDYLIELNSNYKCIFLLGNHDYEWLEDCKRGDGVFASYKQGAKETLESYSLKGRTYQDIAHMDFLEKCLPYYISNNNLFVHGGYNRHYPITDPVHNSLTTLIWDRDLILQSMSFQSMRDTGFNFRDVNSFNWKFVGHTPVQYFDKVNPMILSRPKLVLCDTGCGKYTKELKIIFFDEVNEKIEI